MAPMYYEKNKEEKRRKGKRRVEKSRKLRRKESIR